MEMPNVHDANQRPEFRALTIDEAMADAMITQLQADTPLSQLSHADARRVFDRMVELGYLIAREEA
jgi:hypothetical protein